MNDIKIGSISIETFCHATEDLLKVETAIKTLCNLKEENLAISRNYVYGGYGNMIVMIKIELNTEPFKTLTFQNLNSKMSREDKISLYKNFDRQLEGKHFFARYSKQIALQGGVKIATEDPIRVKIQFNMGFVKKNQSAEIIKNFCLSTHFIEKDE